jgi:hypothetical protein
MFRISWNNLRPYMRVGTIKSEHSTGMPLLPAWLSQAHHVFSTYPISGSKENFGKNSKPKHHLDCSLHCIINPVLLDEFQLVLTLRSWEPYSESAKDIFLFAAIPCLVESFDLKDTFLEWGENGVFYYWSFDPTGAQRLLAEDAELLHLPIFSAYLYPNNIPDLTYHIIHTYQKYKGYDPSTIDYAVDHGWPLLDSE